jgi:hypothetical protein
MDTLFGLCVINLAVYVCSLYLMLHILLVWPTYFFGQVDVLHRDFEIAGEKLVINYFCHQNNAKYDEGCKGVCVVSRNRIQGMKQCSGNEKRYMS